MEDWTKKNLDWFYKNIDPILAAYREPIFAFLAYCDGAQNKLIGARILLSPLEEVTEDKTLKVGNFIGFKGKISSIGVTVKELIEALLDHKVPLPAETLILSRNENYHSPALHRVAKGIDQEQTNTLDFRLSGTGLCEGFHLSEEDL